MAKAAFFKLFDQLILQPEYYRKCKSYTYGLSALPTGLPTGHLLYHTDSLSVE